MKNLTLKIVLFLILSFIAYSQKFEFTPININFNGIAVKDSIIAVSGDFGSMFLSLDKGKTWSQQRVFRTGKIMKLFPEDDRIVAMNDNGEVKTSKDKGNTWKSELKLADSILAVISYPEGYLIRERNRLITLSNDFKISHSYPFYSKPLYASYNYAYTRSISYFKNEFVIAIDSAEFMKFDFNLNYLGNISFSELGLCSQCIPIYHLEQDDNYLYTHIETSLFRTKDLITFEKYYNCSKYYLNFKLFNGVVYIGEMIKYKTWLSSDFNCKLLKVINSDSAMLISNLSKKVVTLSLNIDDFYVDSDKLMFMGKKKFLSINKPGDSEINLITEFSGFSPTIIPDRINDSSYLFITGFYDGFYRNFMYRTDDNGITFKPTIDEQTFPKINEFSSLSFKINEESTNTIYFGGVTFFIDMAGILSTTDTAKNFKYQSIPYFIFHIAYSQPFYPYLPQIPNAFKNDDYYLITYFLKNQDGLFDNYICRYDKKWNWQGFYTDSNSIVDYIIDSKDTNSYMLHCLNLLDSTLEIRYTTDKGNHIDIIKKYPITDSLLYFKEFYSNHRKYFGLVYFCRRDSLCSFDALDINARTVSNIYQYKVKVKPNVSVMKNAICSDSNFVYFAIPDTLFFISDLFNRSKWKYYVFPDNGNIINNFKNFGKKFIARYEDKYNPDNLYWFTISDTTRQKPVIQTGDADFGKREIRLKDSVSKPVHIFNLSNTTDLIIYGHSIILDSVFLTDLPSIDSLNPIIIKPSEFYTFNISFRPKEARVYGDSLIIMSNADSIKNIVYINGEGIDTTSNVIELINETNGYFYSFPPYPLPSSSVIRTLIYWDNSSDIDNDDIGVYDIYGEKVSGREKITIEKSNFYSGYLSWDCSLFDNGIYLIKIKHGNHPYVLKVIVLK